MFPIGGSCTNRREYQRRLKREPGHTENNEHLQARIQKVKCGIVRLVDAYEDGLLEKSDFELRIRRARERLSTLEAEVKKQADEQSQARSCDLLSVISRGSSRVSSPACTMPMVDKTRNHPRAGETY